MDRFSAMNICLRLSAGIFVNTALNGRVLPVFTRQGKENGPDRRERDKIRLFCRAIPY
jgi:hypothetical protein